MASDDDRDGSVFLIEDGRHVEVVFRGGAGLLEKVDRIGQVETLGDEAAGAADHHSGCDSSVQEAGCRERSKHRRSIMAGWAGGVEHCIVLNTLVGWGFHCGAKLRG